MAGLVLIVFLIITIGWLIRRVGGVPMMGGQAMKVNAVLSLGTREKVVLVDIGDKQVLLGVAPGRISHIQSFDEPVVSNTVNTESSADFSSTIKNLLQQNKRGGQS
ncbi:flagellar biosynthetic protein FliO [Oceanicoccus sagamiensis]|uniref:Flagellar protein n=1 Tax=Oceanicoccus sagamiensis TaxID=716816 RepID=A0A1X9NG22_9GAMM|nr:flagellar biosynthetic protein FliO [Oceanicoccus sagamiensis]